MRLRKRVWVACAATAALLALPASALAVPGAPSSVLAARTITNQKPSLTWSAPSSTGTGVTGYNVYRGATKLTTTPVSSLAYTDTALTTPGSYSYTVTAIDSNGDGPASSGVPVTFDNVAPAAPTGLSATTPTPSKPSLTWVASVDGGTSPTGVVAYEVSRAGSPISGNLSTTSYLDSTAPTGSQSYTVRAIDAAGNYSTASTAKAVVYDPYAPNAPVINAPAATNIAPVITWTAPTDTGGSAVVGYEIYRNGTLIGNPSPPTAVTFTDTNVPGAGSYTYSVIAVDGAGNRSLSSNAKTVLFDATTPGSPGAPQAAATPTKDKPVITFTAATDNTNGAGIARYNVYRSGSLVGNTATTTFTDSTLTTSGTYVYTVKALDGAGNESGATGSVLVVYDNVAPTVPTSVTATTPTNVKPVLSWTGSTDVTTTVVRYDVYRGAVLAGSTTGTTFTDTAITAQGSQSYTVKAVDAAGNVSAASSTKAVIYDVTNPVPPTVAGPVATNAAPTITWTASTDSGGSGLLRYDVYRDGVLLGPPPTPTGTAFTDATATAQGSYDYTVRAVDNAGNQSPVSNTRTIVVDTTAPGVPGAPSAATPTSVKPVLTWAAATDTGGAAIARYEIYRGPVLAGSSTSASFTDAAAGANQSYDYTVRAIDTAGNIGPFGPATTVIYDTGVPPTPTGLSATTPTNPKPVLTWLSGGADNLSGFDHYNVYRTGTLVGTTTALTFSDSALSASGTQTYTVKAVDAAGNVSNASAGKAVIWDPLTPNAPGKPTIPSPATHPTLTWSAATDTGGSLVARYDVYRGSTLAGSSTTTTFVDPAALTDGIYTYKVVAIDGAGNVSIASPSNSVIVDASAPTAPAGLTAVTPTIAKPALTWSPATDNVGGSGVAKYNVYRGIVLAGSSTGTTFTDNGLTVNGTYGYTVRAVDAAGNEGPPSSQFDVVFDSAAPPVPTNLTAATPTGAAPVLSWTSGGAASDFDHYNVYRAGALVGMTPTTAFTDSTLTLSGSYVYTVKSVDVNGNQSSASTPRTVVYDVTAPSTPATVNAATPTNHPVLTWTAGIDTGGAALAGYAVYRGGAFIGTTTTLTYTDGAVADGVYTYTVKAFDNAGNYSVASAPRTVSVDTIPPDPPTGLNALKSPASLPQLRWTQASDTTTGGSGIASYGIYRGGIRVTIVPAASFDDTTLNDDDTYTYTVTAIDGAGNESDPSDPVQILFDGTPPPVPFGLQVDAVSQSRPSLTWMSGGPDALSGFDHYEILRNGIVVGTSTTESFSDNLLMQNGAYVYTIRSVDAAGATSAPSPPRNAIWDDTAPAPPQDVVSPNPTNLPVLTWPAVSDTGGSNGVVYHVFRDGAEIGSTPLTIYTDHDPLSDATYTYRVEAVDAAGNVSPLSTPSVITVDVTPPPQVPSSAGDSPTQRPVITWGSVLDDSGIARYNVYRNGLLIGWSSAPTYVDAALSVDGIYAYTVVAQDAAGNLGQPSAPVTTWQSGGVDNLSGFDHYTVYRDGDRVADTVTTSFVDSHVTVSGPHVYTIKAFDKAGNVSVASPPKTVLYDTQPPPSAVSFTIPQPTNLPTLVWNASNDDRTGGSGVVGYHVYRDGQLLTTTTAPRFADASISASGSHAYWVTAVDAVGNESLATQTIVVYADRTPPPPPGSLTGATPTPKPVLSWSASNDDTTGNSGLDHYNIYRNDVLLATVPTPGYIDGSVTASGRYVYTVRAVDGAGNVSDPSAPAVIDVDMVGPQLSHLAFPRQRVAGEAVPFSVSAIDPEGSAVAPPVWNFGDGTAAGLVVTHVFRDPGVYAVTVTAIDAQGNQTTSAPTTITILPRLSKLSVGRIQPIGIKKLRKAKWKVRVNVTVNQPITVFVSLRLAKKGTIKTVSRNVAAGTTPIIVQLPKSLQHKGTIQVRVTADSSALSALSRIIIR